MCARACLPVCVRACVCVDVHVCVCVRADVCTCVSECAYACVSACVCVYACVCLCVHTHTYTHTSIQTQARMDVRVSTRSSVYVCVCARARARAIQHLFHPARKKWQPVKCRTRDSLRLDPSLWSSSGRQTKQASQLLPLGHVTRTHPSCSPFHELRDLWCQQWPSCYVSSLISG